MPNRVSLVRTGSSPPVALHPASRRRSYLWFSTSERLVGRDSHPPLQVRSRAHWAGCSYARPGGQVELGRTGIQAKPMRTCTDHLHGKREARGVGTIPIVPNRRALHACSGGRVIWIDGSGLIPHCSQSDRHACPGQGRPGPPAEWAGCSYARPGGQVELGRTGIQAKPMEQQKSSARQARSARRENRFGSFRTGARFALAGGESLGPTGQA